MAILSSSICPNTSRKAKVIRYFTFNLRSCEFGNVSKFVLHKHEISELTFTTSSLILELFNNPLICNLHSLIVTSFMFLLSFLKAASIFSLSILISWSLSIDSSVTRSLLSISKAHKAYDLLLFTPLSSEPLTSRLSFCFGYESCVESANFKEFIINIILFRNYIWKKQRE